MEYLSVFFVRNIYFDVDYMDAKDYIQHFMPFGIKKGQKHDSPMPLPISMGKTLEFGIVFSRNDAERIDWLYEFFREFYLHFISCYYYSRTDNPAMKEAYKSRICAFHEYGLGFEMQMEDKPVMVWDFEALKTLIETVYGFVVSEKTSL